ncbi:LOG family protein [Zavarzinella formosa]|uniref:LOG family protein n=1 Tax=Zavarzinella formosa TaxID=360055 RepID=UPI0002F5E115|nr:TIGR00730 family Rossman fold protein [Zavarzinella formosa]
MKNIVVFCGSAAGSQPVYAETARRTGELIARRGHGLVYGGGHVGLMGTVADAALNAGGTVIGVITDFLMAKEVGHGGVTELIVVRSMHERKAEMAVRADAFLVLPGGIGTMDEFFEIWTWAMLGDHAKPIGVVNTEGYYDGLFAFADHMVAQGFLKPKYRELVLVGDTPESVLDQFNLTEGAITA